MSSYDSGQKLFSPLTELNKKPIPYTYIQINEAHNTVIDTTDEPILQLHTIVENNISFNRSLDRNKIYQNLRYKGYLVGNCASVDTIDTIDTDTSFISSK